LVVWDVDDVLNELTSAFLATTELMPMLGSCASEAEEYVLSSGISRIEYLASLDRFRLDHYDELTVNPQVLSWFTSQGADYDHLALSMTPMLAAPKVASWVLSHLGTWIRGFMFVPSPRESWPNPLPPQTKGDFLRRLAAPVVFVDDSLGNIKDAQTAGFLSLRFPTLWNGGGTYKEFTAKLDESLQLIST
jgi:hypothetical protein